MEENTKQESDLNALEPLNFMQRMKLMASLPSVFHGLLMGAVLFGSKVVFYLSNHWQYIIEPPFLFFSFILIVYAIFAASRAERNEYQQYFTYGKALLTGLRVVLLSIALSVLADAVLYNIDSSLAAQTIEIQVEKTIEGFKQINFMSDADKDLLIKSIKEQQPGSLSTLIGAWFGKVLANAFFVLIIALFTRYRKPYSWLTENSNENQGN